MIDYRVQYVASSDGASIACARGGEGPPVVLVPPMARTIEDTWDWYSERIGEGHELIAYDRRGLGWSNREPCDDPEQYVADLLAVIEASGHPRIAIVGVLAGCLEAISVAAAVPDRVSQLVLRSPIVRGSDLMALPRMRARHAALEHDWEFFVRAMVHAEHGWGSPLAFKRAEELLRATSQEEYIAMSRAFERFDVTDRLQDVTCPTLVEHFRNDYFPVEFTRQIVEAIPNCRFVAVEGVATSEWPNARAFLAEPLAADDRHASVPSGFQTILFTDLESSTALTQRLGDEGAQEILRGHNGAVRAALESNGGREVKHTGDGIMASFPSAVAAVTAAIEIQRELAGGEVRVRIGLNAGEPIAEEDDLFGTAVQLAARITDCAGPGQVLVSNVVRELCAGKGFHFNSAGEAALKGFDDPVALFEVQDGNASP